MTHYIDLLRTSNVWPLFISLCMVIFIFSHLFFLFFRVCLPFCFSDDDDDIIIIIIICIIIIIYWRLHNLCHTMCVNACTATECMVRTRASSNFSLLQCNCLCDAFLIASSGNSSSSNTNIIVVRLFSEKKVKSSTTLEKYMCVVCNKCAQCERAFSLWPQD